MSIVGRREPTAVVSLIGRLLARGYVALQRCPFLAAREHGSSQSHRRSGLGVRGGQQREPATTVEMLDLLANGTAAFFGHVAKVRLGPSSSQPGVADLQVVAQLIAKQLAGVLAVDGAVLPSQHARRQDNRLGDRRRRWWQNRAVQQPLPCRASAALEAAAPV